MKKSIMFLVSCFAIMTFGCGAKLSNERLYSTGNSAIPSLQVKPVATTQPTPPAPPAPPPAVSVFPTLDQPLFVDLCFFLVPNGKESRITAVGIGENGKPVMKNGTIKPDKMVELMKFFENAVKEQGVDVNVLQMLCFPTQSPATPAPNAPKHQVPVPSGLSVQNDIY